MVGRQKPRCTPHSMSPETTHFSRSQHLHKLVKYMIKLMCVANPIRDSKSLKVCGYVTNNKSNILSKDILLKYYEYCFCLHTCLPLGLNNSACLFRTRRSPLIFLPKTETCVYSFIHYFLFINLYLSCYLGTKTLIASSY